MPAIGKQGKGEAPLRAIQALMCEMGADPPGYFDPVPRQALRSAITDPELPPLVRCLEWTRFHTVCYDGVPKNADGEPQRSPYCVGLDGKRLNRLDCARETGLSSSVVNRQFATLHRLGYVQIRKDGSIWYRAKVEPRGTASLRTSVSECLKRPAQRSEKLGERVLPKLVAERLIPASLAEAAAAFPEGDRSAVEAHIVEVARWEREEIARQMARVRQEAERRYQAAAWNGYRLQKDGRKWVRAPAQQNLFNASLEPAPPTEPAPNSVPEKLFVDHSPAERDSARDERRADAEVPASSGNTEERGDEPGAGLVPRNDAAAEPIRRVFAGTGKGIPTDQQLADALACLPKDATLQGFAAFVRTKLPGIRHAGALPCLAQEYAHEIRYGPRPPSFGCTRCRDEGFVLPGGQFCECPVGVRRRRADQQPGRAKAQAGAGG